MGGIITLLASIGEIATELSATTGITLESILTGEALAALEAEVTSLMTIEGISGIEALAQLGFTAEQFANFSLVASMVNQGLTYGFIFQTISGISSLISVGVRLAREQVSQVNRDVSWAGSNELLRHALLSFSLDPLQWENSLLHSVGREVFESLSPTSRQLQIQSNLVNLILNSRWVAQSMPAQNAGLVSGETLVIPEHVGGTFQQQTPDWLLPLILGLSGYLSPELQVIEDGTKKKSSSRL
ncbi:VP2 [Pan troglodytes verus polyomavirus 2c]|uniref:Minor capsid protein VP2 n=9 Tax=Alphapolyomavirus TaxID=1891713 RepID=E5LA53_9POLY|nr:VP2 [Pan troglodytes verus polyomavirus 2c]ADQ54198.1 VP2 [Pan troglodytes verus polyomavirus 2c]ADQ54203.1 VP2 [Pan troglodytes verus polyomavirus 2c]